MPFMLRFLPIFCCIALLGACASKAVPPDYVGLSEADVVAKHGYPIDRRIVADDVVVLVFRSRLGSERFGVLLRRVRRGRLRERPCHFCLVCCDCSCC